MLIAATLQLHSYFWLSCIAYALILFGYLAFSSGTAVNKYKWILLTFVILFVYSIGLSKFTERSAYFALSYFFSFLFFCTISDFGEHLSGKTANIDNTSDIAINSCKKLLLIFSVVQSIALIYQYSIEPIRSTGLFLDYSQASLIILLAFGMNYHWLKNNKWTGSLITLILFIGFFTTFSRTCNFLLVVLMALIGYAEWREKNLKFVTVTGITIIAAYALVVSFTPWLLESVTIDRGGLAHMSTLNSRTIYWQSALDAIYANPWWGHGLGNFEYLGIKEFIPYSSVNSAHNDYLQIFVDIGIVWLCLFTVSVISLLYFHLPFFKGSGANLTLDSQYLAWCLILCLTLYMLINFVIHSMLFQLTICLIIYDLIEDGKA